MTQPRGSRPSFSESGVQLHAGAASAVLEELNHALHEIPPHRAGVRLRNLPGLKSLLLTSGPIGAVAASVLGRPCAPVRAILFDKNEATNWSLGWHQDRTIAVAERVETDGFGPWTVKAGMHHVAPPIALLAGMVTLRVHLDPVPVGNAPLLAAPGSHLLGRIGEDEIEAVVERCGTIMCLAEAGDIWAYSTLILHSSDAVATPARRRVVQVDYASGALPGGLRWLGI